MLTFKKGSVPLPNRLTGMNTAIKIKHVNTINRRVRPNNTGCTVDPRSFL